MQTQSYVGMEKGWIWEVREGGACDQNKMYENMKE